LKNKTLVFVFGFILFLMLGARVGPRILASESAFMDAPDGAGPISSGRASGPSPQASVQAKKYKGKVTPQERRAAGRRLKAEREQLLGRNTSLPDATLDPGGVPHYFGPWPNYANSPLPRGAVAAIVIEDGGTNYTSPTVTIADVYETGAGATATASVSGGAITFITLTDGGSNYSAPVVYITDTTGTGAVVKAHIGPSFIGGIHKFVDSLPQLDTANNLGQFLPVAIPDRATYPGSDYYEIALVEYSEQLHSDLPVTRIRGYVQTNGGPGTPHYMGPIIVARRDVPVRVKFTNLLPTGSGGDLFIPVDTTVMGAGMGPMGGMYTQNRSSVHLHGNNTVWISDGSPHQWITPAGESTSYPKGVSAVNVPDMPDPGSGSMTFYYTNAQSARLMFYHDHAYGITRLNVYAGMAAGYLITDDVEQDMINGTNTTGVNPTNAKVLPDLGIPLIIQDKTFVDELTIGAQDPTWNWGIMPGVPHTGDLWMPHVYMPNQNPYDIEGVNAFGRWHYGPWFWPPTTNITRGPVTNPYLGTDPLEPPLIPGVPDNSMAMESFMDTPVVNGTVYPYLVVEPRAYRFRILSVGNERFFNLQLYEAYDPSTGAVGAGTEVKMVPAVSTPGYPRGWPTDGREGGVPDPATAGPSFIQIGTEGGFLPAPVVLPNVPVGWNWDQTNFDFGNVNQGTLLLGPAERADVIVDFSAFAGKTLILYNDAPAPFPAIDPRYDYYTGNPDLTEIGGAPPTQAGYGPNTRTIMQIRVAPGSGTGFDLNALESVFAKTASKRGVFEVSQDEIIVAGAEYNSAYDQIFPKDPYVRIHETSKTFATPSGTTITLPLEPKAIQDEMGEAYDAEYGRMSGFLGLELPNTAAGNQDFVLLPFASPPVEIIKGSVYGTPIGSMSDGTQLWKITHNGVDTHTIHTHLFNAQIVNRVAWDNAIRPPDPNELGWKETIRVNPLQDTILALRPIIPEVPFPVPNSVRLIDPTMPEGVELMGGPRTGFMDPSGVAVTVLNHMVNYGWEYMMHCHLLGHEEMDMMHAVSLAVPPAAPTNLVAAVVGKTVVLNWTDNSSNETGFTIQRATSKTGDNLTTFTVGENVTTFADTTIPARQVYFYKIFANNAVGDTTDYPSPAVGFPVVTVDSGFSNAVKVGQDLKPLAPTNLRSTSVTSTTISLAWDDNSNNETGFRIQRATSRFGDNLATFLVGANVTTFTTTGLNPNTTYYFQVQAINLAGNSGFSNAIKVKTAP
jgi:FtsP/CotA-like multicopper oxidase with cupredoxin domain